MKTRVFHCHEEFRGPKTERWSFGFAVDNDNILRIAAARCMPNDQFDRKISRAKVNGRLQGKAHSLYWELPVNASYSFMPVEFRERFSKTYFDKMIDALKKSLEECHAVSSTAH